MKHKIFFNFLLITCFYLKAQDTLFLKNGNKVIAKVMEINPNEIKYTKDNTDSRLYVVAKSDVLLIKYQNSYTDTILKGTPACKMNVIQIRDARFYDNIKALSIKNILVRTRTLAVCKNIPQLNELAIKIEKNGKRQTTLAITGAACTVTGAVFTLFVALSGFEYKKNFISRNTETFGRCIAGLLCLAVHLEISSLMFGISKKHHLKKSVELYNKHLL